MPKDVLEEKLVNLAEVREILQKRQQESGVELTYVQQVTLDYVNKFCRYSLENARKLQEELISRFKISERAAIQLTNLSNPPTLPVELNIILDKEPIELTEEQKKDLVDLIQSYVEKP